MNFLIYLIVGGIAGWLASIMMKRDGSQGIILNVIVGIIGVATIYGRDMGRFRVIDALATLTFDFPPQHPRAQARQAFFQDELEQFLSLAQRTGMDPLSPLGSYAGAMGMPQFMPSSWVKYAIDYDGDGRIDLWNSEADVIGSVEIGPAHHERGCAHRV